MYFFTLFGIMTVIIKQQNMSDFVKMPFIELHTTLFNKCY